MVNVSTLCQKDLFGIEREQEKQQQQVKTRYILPENLYIDPSILSIY